MGGNGMAYAGRAYAPGRTEIAGNHTDHQGGRVIAAAVSCGVEVVAERVGGMRATVESAGFPPVRIDLSDTAPRESERATSAALVRGMVAGLREAGVPVGGFHVQVESTVPPGGGLSSSAAFELAVGRALCALFAEDGAFPDEAGLACIAQAAERTWFGKPCGLMDQMACALGGVNVLDFADEGRPRAEAVPFSFEDAGYALCLVDVRSDHSAYTDEYARVPQDMFAVARLLGGRRLADVPEGRFVDGLARVRRELGDRAALRAQHFYLEMALVDERARALRAGDMPAFLAATRRSAASSAQFLQNVSCFGRADQPAMVALAAAERLLEGEGAARIHGGGFGGSIQAYVPRDRLEAFSRGMDGVFGEGACRAFGVDGAGARCERVEGGRRL